MEKFGIFSGDEWFILMNLDTGLCQPFSVQAIRREWVLVDGPFESEKVAEIKLHEICVEFMKGFYLREELAPEKLKIASRKSHRADLTICNSYDGQILTDEVGWNRFKGECATGIQYVCHKSNDPLGTTSGWRPGDKVRGNNIPPGTAIASFRNGVYADDHAAIFIEELSDGLKVWDQYNNPSKPWGIRILRFDYVGSHPYSNDGDLFSVIQS